MLLIVFHDSTLLLQECIIDCRKKQCKTPGLPAIGKSGLFIMMAAQQLFQKFSDLFSSHAAGQCVGNNVFCLFAIQLCCNLFIGISLFLFELYNLFVEFFQFCFFGFSLSIQRGNIRAKCCNFFSKRFCGSILFSNLCRIIDTVKNFYFVLASFRSSHNKTPPYILDTRLYFYYSQNIVCSQRIFCFLLFVSRQRIARLLVSTYFFKSSGYV
nr:MAG TPA: hypothetical protein [Caudoviricetes sp.]